MSTSDELKNTVENLIAEVKIDEAIEVLRQAHECGEKITLQVGKSIVNIGQGKDIHIGDRTYITWNEEAIQALIEVVQKLQSTTQTPTPQLASVDQLVQQVRSRLHDDIQRLHSTMPLWGVDRWVPLGDLFVDVNILEELSSSRKSELDDLWQDFSNNPSDRSLDRIGLGRKQQRVSGLEVLEKNTNLMVVGKPGSGKTTYLQRVVTECNGGNLQAHRIPVLIKLREFVEDGRDVAYSLELYLERCWRLSDAETQLIFNRGRVLVLLDGLDEVAGEDGKNITKEIKRFARVYPQVQVIVACRTQSQESRFERFDYVEVADFYQPQVEAFAEHWFKAVMGDESAGLAKSKEFLEQLFLKANQPIRELAITPILLSLTCAVFHQTGKFYSKRSKLYEEGLELLLEQWDERRGIERDEIYRDLSVERKLELLSYLAVKKFEQPQYVLFEQAEIEDYIAEFLGIGQRDSRAVLRTIEAQHGLLIKRAQKVWSFSHLTFQEYLVGKWFCDREDWDSLTSNFKQRYWREVFLISLEITQNADALIFLMKEECDALLAEEEKLQQFLRWLDKKTQSNNEVYKPPAIRAFFLEIAIDRDLGNVSLINDVYAMICHIPGLESANYDDPSFNLSIANVHHYSWGAYITNKLDQNLSYAKLLKLSVSSKALEWWEGLENHVMILWALINEYSEIYQKWQLSDQQQHLLWNYYDANKLIVDGLSNACHVSSQVRKEIEDTLLLPLAEIEKRKSEKAEYGQSSSRYGAIATESDS